MGSVPTLAPLSITGMATTKDSRLVFFLQLNQNSKTTVVVKGESNTLKQRADTEASIKWGSKIMKNVNNELVNTKILTATEIVELRRAATLFLSNLPNGQKKLQAVSDPQIVLTKLPYVDGLSDAEFRIEADVGQAGDDSTQLIKRLIHKFYKQATWIELGKIVAVDIFNGNQDRFTLNGDWANMGNVMFTGSGATMSVIGLDVFDPNSPFKNLNEKGTHAGLNILSDAARRKAYALQCVTSVGTEMQRYLRLKAVGFLRTNHFTVSLTPPSGGPPRVTQIKYDDLPGFFAPFADDFEAGLAQGAQEMRDYLRRKVMEHRPDLLAPVGSHRTAAASSAVRSPALPPPPPPLAGGRLPPPPAPLVGARLPPPPAPLVAVRLPPAPAVNPSAPPRQASQKTIPPGVLDRMRFLGWL